MLVVDLVNQMDQSLVQSLVHVLEALMENQLVHVQVIEWDFLLVLWLELHLV